MKAISIRQPWAWAIAQGLKTIENRTWRTHYRGPLAIHAGRAPCPPALILPDGTPVQDAGLVCGAVVALVDLVDCLAVVDAPQGPFTEGPFCFVLANVRRITPIPWPGALSLFEIPDEVISGRTPSPHPAAPGRHIGSSR
jgi:hypothetical protein